MIRLTIDGRDITVPEGTLVVDAATRHGIEVPVYCYHESMGSLGACRICLVEIEKMPKLATACTVTATDGMVVHTTGPAVEKGRKGILEFLLINHPLDCPVCDKGGECFLQDYSFQYGAGKNRFEEAKIQRQKDYPVSPYVLLDQERCVLCQRCVRFMSDYVGEEDLLLEGRGVHTVVARVGEHYAESPFLGNVIDLCPVGALLSEPYHFKARPWNIERWDSMCVQCPVGCPASVTGRDGRVMRMEGRRVEGDWGWLCDIGRFSYDFGRFPTRLVSAQLGGQPARMADAARALGEHLADVVKTYGSEAVAVITGARHTLEDEYALSEFTTKVLGAAPPVVLQPVLGRVPLGLHGTFGDLEGAETVLLLGADPYDAVPVVHLKLREAQRRHGQKLLALGDRSLLRATITGREWITEPGRVVDGLAQALSAAAPEDEILRTVVTEPPGVDGDFLELGRALIDAASLAILWDGQDSEGANLLTALAVMRGDRPTSVLPTYGAPNGLASATVGAVDDPDALRDVLERARDEKVKVLILWGTDPIRELPDGALAQEALARCPAVYFGGWFPPVGAEHMAAMLPTAAWAETTGTYVNMEGRLRMTREAASSPQDARPTRTWLQAVARAFGAPLRLDDNWDPFRGLEQDVLPRPALPPLRPFAAAKASGSGEGMALVSGPVTAAAHHPSEVLERTPYRYPVRMHPSDMEALGLSLEGDEAELSAGPALFVAGVSADPRIPAGRVFVPWGLADLPVNRLNGSRIVVSRVKEVTIQ